MSDKGKGKGKGSGSRRPDKLSIVRPPAQTEQNPLTSPATMSSSPAGNSSSTPASGVGVNSPIPQNNADLTPGSSNSHDSSNNESSSRKKLLHLDGAGYVIEIFNNFIMFVLMALMNCYCYRFLPSNTAARAITNLIKSHYVEPWLSWKKIPPKVRELLFEEFLVTLNYFGDDI